MEFVLFGLTLVGVAVFHKKTLQVALCGLTALLAYRLLFTEFDFVAHLHHEWESLVNLAGLLLGFALLATWFSQSRVPDVIPRYLKADWRGPFVLLLAIAVLSSFLDNIAAALIGGTIAATVFHGRVHIGYLAAITAASNAGGAGSVVGDTTTTMMWIRGVPPLGVAHAAVASLAAVLVFGVIASRQQHAHQCVTAPEHPDVKIDWACVFVTTLILVGAIVANWMIGFPAAGVWAAIVLAWPIRRPAIHELPGAAKGACFLLSLVLCASLMPVEKLPPASWHMALGLGFLSAVFDNIPLTALCLKQGGYDWGVLAYAVGFGGSMIWFGSSAGVALSNMYPEAKSVAQWVRNGWHVALAYVIGFFVMLWTIGWDPAELPPK